ncbi:MAG: DsbC family protein [Azoarcus sp.]|jgi:thiol:disulfide interchange protein DsbC|nr:DsbC family protein [Azoarcus sp.]
MTFVFRPLRAVLLMVAAISLLTAPAARADEAGNVRKAVAAFLSVPETLVESVTRIPQGGLYEVLLNNGELFYTDKAVSFVVVGNIIDTKTRENLTRVRLDKLASIDFKSLPLEQAVKRVNGNGKRVIVTFEDPNCGFCKRLGKELQKVKDVSIYTFLYPILSDDSTAKSRHIWCAKDKAAAWVEWIVDGKAPKAAECDSKAIDLNVELGRKLRLTGTPVMFFANGERTVGYMDADSINRALASLPDKADK